MKTPHQKDDYLKKKKAVNSTFKTYVTKLPHQDAVSDVAISYNDFFTNKMLIIEAIQQGIPYKFFEKIKAISPFTDENWADYLEISLKSLSRYKKDPDFHFKRIHSEKIIELAEVTNFGEKVFGSIDKFYKWLQEPSLALGGFKPAELLKNSYGKELVMDELKRIEHGIFA